jgi:hypothetical protein
MTESSRERMAAVRTTEELKISHVNARNRQSQRGDLKSVLAGPAARIDAAEAPTDLRQ